MWCEAVDALNRRAAGLCPVGRFAARFADWKTFACSLSVVVPAYRALTWWLRLIDEPGRRAVPKESLEAFRRFSEGYNKGLEREFG